MYLFIILLTSADNFLKYYLCSVYHWPAAITITFQYLQVGIRLAQKILQKTTAYVIVDWKFTITCKYWNRTWLYL